ncbi:ATP-binding protein, partial [Staphylococcus warneri]
MDVLNFLPFAAVQSVLLFWIVKIILDIKYNLKDYLIVFLTVIPSILMYNYIGNSSLLFLVAVVFLFYYRKIKLYSIMVVLISNLVLYLTNFLTVSLYLTINKYITSKILLLTIHLSTFCLIALLLAFLLRILIKKLRESYLSLNKTYIYLICVVLSISFMFFYIISQTDMSAPNSLRLYAIIFVGLIIFLIIIVFILSMFTLREMRYKRNLQELDTYSEYNLTIES